MKIRYGILFALALISLLSGPYLRPAFAQTAKEPTGLKNVTLWLNPEYDDPRFLMMLEGKIAASEVPAEVRFLVPEAAFMFSAGAKDATGKYTGGPPKRVPSNVPGWDEISYTLKTDTFRVEYYDPIIASQPDKKISYDFRWLYPISDLRVIVMEPRKSSAFAVTPAGRTGTDSEGFNVHSYSYRDLAVNAPPLHFDISYTRSDTRPSLGKTGAGGSGGSSSPSLMIGLVVGLLLAGALVWFLKPRNPAYARKSAARSPQAGAAPARRAPRGRLCKRCGKPIEGTPKFCPHCGAKTG